jgi:hypothetical protein
MAVISSIPVTRPGLPTFPFISERTPSGFAVPRHARRLPLEGRTYFRLSNGTLIDDSGESVDTPTAFRLVEIEADLRAKADGAPSRPPARLPFAALVVREAWVGLLIASLVGYAALGLYLLLILPGHLLGLW